MYRTIDAKFWTDPKIRKLESASKLMALYLITNPHTHVGGIYYLPETVIAVETGLKLPEIERVLDTLSNSGFVKIDSILEVVWVIRMFGYQGRGIKNELAVAAHLKSLHNSFLVNDFLAAYPSVKRRFLDRVSDSGSKWHSEQEQEQEQNTPLSPPSGGAEGNHQNGQRQKRRRGKPQFGTPEEERAKIAKQIAEREKLK